ncbi:MAG: LytTR family DNA-binding domain-containing protein [Acidobacteriota bacterium]
MSDAEPSDDVSTSAASAASAAPPPRRPLRAGRYLFGAATALGVLLAIARPAASDGLAAWQVLPFWLLHAWTAIALLSVAQRVVARWRVAGARGRWLRVLAAGALGSLAFAPAALGLEQLFGIVDGPPDDAFDRLAQQSVAMALLIEWLETLVPVTSAWLVLHLPWLLRLDFAAGASASVAPSPAAAIDASASGSAVPPTRVTADSASTGPASTGSRTGATASASAAPIEDAAPIDDAAAFLDRLPANLGRDWVALSSELHYVRVHTTRGQALVLHSLRDALAALADVPGLQIHRGHWVADDHVVRLQRSGRGLVCVLDTGLTCPVSRRRQRDAIARYGAPRAARYRTSAA